MHNVLFDLLDKCVVVYIDDILIYSRSIAEHKQYLEKVFALLAKNKLRLKDSKCALFLESVEFLGHKINKDGIFVEEGKIEAVKDWKQPETVNQV